jgi:hypothetical protein
MIYYFYIGAVTFFIIGLVVIAAIMDKEDMQDSD